MCSADQCSMLVLFANLSFLLFVLGCFYRGAVTYRTNAFSPLVVSVVIPLVTLIFSIIFSSLRYSMIDLKKRKLLLFRHCNGGQLCICSSFLFNHRDIC